jgi:hypothetical protein
MKSNRVRPILSLALGLIAALVATQGQAASDLFIRDTATDTGVEPYTGPGPIYLSPDIWIRNDPDPNFDPHPFPTATPTWTPLGHQNPEYRNSKTSHPNYVYVRIHNRGNTASSGTERLRLYQAKASTGLAWDADWVDNVGMFCSADRLLGIEITKPRLNAKSVSAAERDAYRDALVKIGSDPNFQYSDMVQYFRKQNFVHSSPNPEHGNPAFLPWHREFMSRYENLLRETDPLVTLLYWDFTQSPTSGTNLFTTSFMGASSGTVSAPLVPLQPPTLTRNVGGSVPGTCGASLFQSDGTFNAMGNYPTLSFAIEEVPNHNCAHGFIGGYGAGAGQISSLTTAAQDPFFFMLHANVDRQWANWQRNGADPDRLDPVAVYGTDSSHARINANMRPWDGTTGLAPWNGVGAATSKTSKDPSIVFPPIYDTAPLRIPVLQPNESVVIEIPWYPPDVNNYNCMGQAGHFCLLARIETSTTAPFGMSTPEGNSVGTNTVNNNNIAWKNITIVDNLSDPVLLMLTAGTTIRNIFDQAVPFTIALVERTEFQPYVLPEYAKLSLGLPDYILDRLGDSPTGLRDLDSYVDPKTKRQLLQVTGKDPQFSVLMEPGETFTAEFLVELYSKDIPKELLAEPFYFDIEQRADLPPTYLADQFNHPTAEIGGVRFTFDFAQIAKAQKRQGVEAESSDLRLQLIASSRKALDWQADASASAQHLSAQHLSVGEPFDVIASREGAPDTALRSLSLEVDGRKLATAEGPNELSDSVSFDEPGVHTIVARAVLGNGETQERRTRILVSESIPPAALILKPASGSMFKVGETIRVVAAASAAYRREVAEMSLYVKEGDLIETGTNLVLSPNYDPVASFRGPGPHEFEFTPTHPGMYMLQLGAVDDQGTIGVSGHAMIMVHEH